MRAVWFTWAGVVLSLANIVAGWSWAQVDADTRIGTSVPQGIDWSQASLWLGVPATVTIVLTAAALRRSRTLLWVGAVAMGLLFVPYGGTLLMDLAGMTPDGTGLDPWARAAHLVGMFLALPAVVAALWLAHRDSRRLGSIPRPKRQITADTG